MLLGAAIMIALMRDRGDDGRLIVIPAMRGDAGLLANRRARAIGGDQKPRGDRFSPSASVTSIACGACSKPSTAVGTQIDAQFLRLRHQRIDQMPVLDHVRERLARLDLAAERQESRPHRVVELGVGHHHVEDRLRGGRRPRPRRRSSRTAAAPPPRSPRRAGPWTGHGQRRIGDRHREAVAQPLAQRDGQRQTGKAGAADHHVTPFRFSGRHCCLSCRHRHR